jgi:hypothetical protein
MHCELLAQQESDKTDVQVAPAKKLLRHIT